MHNTIENVMRALERIGAVKFGEFKLKSGQLSPIYIDLRLIISYPQLLQEISQLLWQKIKNCSFERLCGVPYTAIPMATAISIEHQIPMLMRRKEVKAYGTGKIIEGVFEKGMKVLVIDDLVTSGLSIFETIAPLEEAGLCVQDIVVLLDRQQGGKDHIEKKGYHLHSLFTLKEMLDLLHREHKISSQTLEQVEQYLCN